MLTDGDRGTGAPKHRRTGLRCLGTALWIVITACASTGDPPGGPPDQQPPTVLRIEPESGAVLTTLPSEVNVYFDEVIAERVAGQPTDISGSVLLSPAEGEVRVGWHRDRISVKPRGGFVAGRIYHLQVLPVVTDLRTNRLRAERTVVFSTGPAIPDAGITGAVVDWVAGRPAVRALIEAVWLPDSLVYRALTDSAGYFRLSQIPPGRYLVRGVMDTNNDRRLGVRESFDSTTIALDTAAAVELFAFAHDTTGPRLRLVEVADSLSLKLTFDRPLDPSATFDTSMIRVATQADSTTALELVGVFTPKALDALRTHAADSAAAAKAEADSIAAAADTTRPPPVAAARPTAPAPSRGAVSTGRTGGRTRAPLDSTRAERMIARRPAPSDIRIVVLSAPLLPDTRYLVRVTGARSLSGNESDAPGQVRTPKRRRPTERPNASHDSTGTDSTVTARDSAPPAVRPRP